MSLREVTYSILPVDRLISEVRERSRAYVLDASALLAVLQSEAGGELVRLVLECSVMSTVNWSEVVQKSLARGVETAGMRCEVEALGLTLVSFSKEEAETAGELWQTTRSAGLSLGDRACLALATKMGVPALTTDRAWADLDLPAEVQLVR